MNETKDDLIQWPRAKYWTAQWNPIIGCKPCSPACENCYAAAWAKRYHKSFAPHESAQKCPPSKGVVFCGNLTDVFGDWNSYSLIVDLICRCLKNKTIPYLWLTKRVVKMCGAVRALCPQMTNHYFGFTAENQEWYHKRMWETESFPSWANLWLSAEPLLEPITLRHPLYWGIPFKWVVVGCESGPNRRPCKIEWVESIVDQCTAAKIPVFVKQLEINGRCETDINRFPAHLRIRQVPWANKGEQK